ncbi:conserved protein of unknown function [Candidatus Promineifilum breve]|uniref:DUF2281 domain-containing protein n=1 Tax=Candidatus Promineifilum breve TaxID=1806508 RepID=A0A160T7A7_9CHLR|nr:hypothetical protein [Candidatus Promineifilum breve]CUS05198.2 conserved protein of unknown function [Candidatus Promineifilum breve]
MDSDLATNRDYEQAIVEIVRVLPPSRAEQLFDFARFLEAQILSEELLLEESSGELEADNARWDALLESDEGQLILENLAHEALVEHRAGRTKPMISNSEGRLAPE